MRKLPQKYRKWEYEDVLKIFQKMHSMLLENYKKMDEPEFFDKTGTISDCCCKLKVSRKFVQEMTGKYNGTEITDIYDMCLTLAETIMQKRALLGKVNPGVAIFSLKVNHGWIEQQYIKTDNMNHHDGEINVNLVKKEKNE